MSGQKSYKRSRVDDDLGRWKGVPTGSAQSSLHDIFGCDGAARVHIEINLSFNEGNNNTIQDIVDNSREYISIVNEDDIGDVGDWPVAPLLRKMLLKFYSETVANRLGIINRTPIR